MRVGVRSNLFCVRSLKNYLYFARFLSTQIKKFADRKLSLENKFTYGEYFQDRFQKTVPNITYGRENVDQQRSPTWKHKKMKVRKPEDVSYRGEILFGIHPIYLALKQRKRQFYQLFLKNDFTVNEDFSKKDLKLEIGCLAREIGIDIKKVSTGYLNSLVPNSVHQGVCLDASVLPMFYCDGAEDFKSSDEFPSCPLWLVLDSIQDPMNFGAVLRSSYFFGVDRIITVRNNSCRLSPTVSKASSGAMEVMDIFCINDLKDFVQRKKSNGWSIISTAAYDYRPVNGGNSDHNLVELSQFSLRKPTVLILGNEAKGVSSEIQSLCDAMISIHPKKDISPCIDSLNVSVATGIILHHMKNSCKLG